VAEETGDVTELPKARIVSATAELNQIADDVQKAQSKPEASPPTVPKAGVSAEERPK
jgi:hypothetical protein